MSDLKIALYGKRTTSTYLGDLIPVFLEKIREKEILFQIEKDFYEVLKNIGNIDLEGVEIFSTHEELWQDLDYFFTFWRRWDDTFGRNLCARFAGAHRGREYG